MANLKVELGAEWLDWYFPGWHTKVNLLEVKNVSDVLDQVVGPMWEDIAWLAKAMGRANLVFSQGGFCCEVLSKGWQDRDELIESWQLVTLTRRYKDRMVLGIQWLDSHKPNWRDVVNAERLNMVSCGLCVIGQAFASWACRPDDPYMYGFDVIPHNEPECTLTTEAEYDILTELWRAELERMS